ncbi:hypothetical protein PV325_003562 [Microctonus aethiopoides]|nr:hypothetical protein PV325_003562 [Microctonus aethiopoides]
MTVLRIITQTSAVDPEIIGTQWSSQNVEQSSIISSSAASFNPLNYCPPVDNSHNLIPPVATLTSDVPQIPTGVSVSTYRLGNQRRLKYVPPPNLTSTVQKPQIQLPIIGQLDAPPNINSAINPHHHLLKPTDSATAIGNNLTTSGELNLIHDAISPSPIKYPSTSSVISSSNTYQDYIDGNKLNSTATPVPQSISQTTLTSVPLGENVSSNIDIIPNNSVNISSVSTFFDTKINTTASSVNEPAQIDLIQTPHNFQSQQLPGNIIGTQFNVVNQQNSNSSALFYNSPDFTTKYDSSTTRLFTPTLINDSISNAQSPIDSGFDLTSQRTFTSAMPEPTGTATLNPIQISLNPLLGSRNNVSSETIPYSLEKLASSPTINKKMSYRPVYYHWFYRREIENKIVWNPFSMHDSLNLETVYNSNEITPETTVATDGGRYDVEILKRQRTSVYWPGPPLEVRRSSWFYKGPSESRLIPYDENTATRLEEEYKHACLTDQWNRRIDLSNGEYIIFHSSTIQVHYLPTTSPELVASWGNSSGASSRPKVVKRGVDEFHIDEGEPEIIDHLLFLVHGIGSVCDLKFRTVEEVVDEFRSISLQLVQSHYRTANTHGIVNRIEVLPISWHTTLHSEATGIDKKLEAITLESIPKLRHFTNDTLLDVLFYTSPTYCQTIMQTVGNEMNRLHTMFKKRNPGFTGSVYLGGHSLGSLILFDLLCHQKPPIERLQDDILDESAVSDNDECENEDGVVVKPKPRSILKRRLSRRVSYVMGTAGTGQPFINYPQLNFHPKAFFALGSPIGMFVTIRGIDNLGKDFILPTCPAFFNIFHPFDPVAYRIESLVNSDASKYRPMLIPHHKGRKRMHLELKETMARVGADLKQKVLDSMRSTWNSVYHLAMFHRSDNQELEHEIDKVVEEQLQSTCEHSRSMNSSANDDCDNDDDNANLDIGKLNGGRRIDYVLQEAPLEYINEYIFALTSHVCYWESEDTMLFILKEMYGSNGIQADAQLPQQIMRATERGSLSLSSTSLSLSETSFVSGPSTTLGTPVHSEINSTLSRIDPTTPMTTIKSVGPPPTSGFIRKT